jgi:uncharacterized protein (TIGR02001 family)
MKFNRKTLAGSIATSLIAVSAMVPLANAEVSGSAGIASSYLWRGLDLGSGTPAVSGALKFSGGGFYTGIWGSSGDQAMGTEYDLSAGYGGTAGDFSYGLAAISYNYPTGANTEFGDYSDAVVSLGFGPVSFGAYIPVGKTNSSGDYMYFTLGASVASFSFLLGMHSDDVAGGGVVKCEVDSGSSKSECSPFHLDFSYAYNDNLSFTFSQFIDDKPFEDKLKFVVSYSLPIGE